MIQGRSSRVGRTVENRKVHGGPVVAWRQRRFGLDRVGAYDPAAPAAGSAAVRPPARDRLERLLPEPRVRTAEVLRAASGADAGRHDRFKC